MTNPSEVVADLRIAAEDARRFSAALFDRGYVRREGVRPFSELLERAADTIDRLTSTGEAVLRVPFNWIAVLGDARNAIASLDEGALGYFEKAPHHHWPLRDELLSNIDKALADPAASPREGHVEDAEALRVAREVISDMVRYGLISNVAGTTAYYVGDNVLPTIMGRPLPHNQGETK